MRSHGRHKRSKSNKDADNEVYMNMQAGDDLHPEDYSRSRNSAEQYRSTSRSSRATYSSDRDRVPHSHREDDWHRAAYDHERYTYGDLYSRGGGDRLDDYDDGRRGDSVGWRGVDPNPYPPGHDWSHHYEHVGTSSYAEPSSLWAVSPPVYESSRSSYVGHWQDRENRDLPVDDWEPTGLRSDRTHDRRQDWRQEGRKEKNSQPKHQNDSGWGRRRESDWTRETPTQSKISMDERQDRSWEPAASWKSSNRNDQQQTHRTQNGQRHNGKSKRNQNKQRREWRQADDGDLNNWTRREPSRSGKTTVNQHPPPKRKHGQSPSRSRSPSRSPTVSYRSHQSSRGRSRSPSFSPASKRRRRDDSSPVTLRSRTPSEKDQHHSKYHRHHSLSPSPRQFPGRRGSMSQGSSSGSDRSLSRSPIGHPRSLHRLPTVTLASVVTTNSGKLARNGTSNPKGNETRNGRSRLYKRDRTIRDSRSSLDAEQEEHEERVSKRSAVLSISGSAQYSEHPTNPINISMPPPPSLPPSHAFRCVTPSEGLPATRNRFAEPRVDTTPKQNHVIPMKGAGFKPIGKANSAIKKFFPGDEEDMDCNSEPRDHYSIDNTQTHPLRSTSEFSWTNGGDHIPEPVYSLRDIISEPKQRHNDKPVELPHSDVSPEYAAWRSTVLEPVSVTTTKEVNDRRASPRDEAKALTMADPPFSPMDSQDIPTDILSVSSHKDLYRIVNQVGEGTFGKVYKAQNTLNGGHVALKRIRMESEKDGFPVTAMREIKLLQSLRHENVVRLYEMMVSRGSVFMVFEYMDHDLTGILSQSQFTFSDAHLKSLCHQMFAGLAYLHHKGVIHRDIKGSNILVNNRGELKLADFGLARFYQKRRRADYTNRVITLWYRPPELLFGATVYGPEVDIWSAGCIMLELFTKKPIFQGNDEIHQVEVLFKLLGTPTLERWPDVMNLPWYELVKPQQVMPYRFREAFEKWLSLAGLDLAEQLLTYDPAKRISAWQAMEAPYFIREAPAAAKPVGLVEIEGEWHELETKRERAKRKERRNQT